MEKILEKRVRKGALSLQLDLLSPNTERYIVWYEIEYWTPHARL